MPIQGRLRKTILDEPLDNARASLTRLYTALRDLPTVTAPLNSEAEQRFRAALDDDFNTPEAIAILFELAREINRLRREQHELAAAETAALLKKLAGILGLLERDAETWFKAANQTSQIEGLEDAEIEALIQQRLLARTQKNWAESDRIRDELKTQGILLEDKAGMTTWRRV